ncbi:MAG: regulatory protein RecX [Candidatus Omnitrophica bacterium]|nr:regulatory protein RecX [Candidatus Omnitrophota bacterium]MDD5237633.1 regulatory protein RecX [Candidatus Omnitrophota bacterium]
MNKKDSEGLQKARNYAFLLLKFRQRSEKELYRRLKKKKFEEEVVAKTISFLKDKRFVDDELFAKSWIESRLKRPCGLRKIENELNLKGVDKKIIERQILEIKKHYSEEEIAGRIAKIRFAKFKDIEQQTAKRRLYGYLLRRGFSPEVISGVVNQLCRQTS